MTTLYESRKRGRRDAADAVYLAELEAPQKGRRIYFDRHNTAPRGFGVRVSAAGTVAFVLRYQNAEGRDRLLTIGEWGAWSLAAAREEANERRRDIDRGADILEQRRQERTDLSVAEVVKRYCADRVEHLATAGAVRAMLDRHLVCALGVQKINKVSRGEIRALVRALATTHPRQAGKVLVYIKQLFEYAEDEGIIEGNPVASLKPSKLGQGLPARSRGRVLDDDEIRGLWHGAESSGMHKLTALALKLVLVTAQRPGEVVGMRWDEIYGGLWIIPAARRQKTNTPLSVPLTETAISLLDAARAEAERLGKRYTRTGEYVFELRAGQPLKVNGLDHAASGFAKQLGNKDKSDWGHWRPHDLRRTARTGMATERVDETVAELTIGHTRKGIAAVYDLHRYDPEKREALETWERRLQRIITATEDEEVDAVTSVAG